MTRRLNAKADTLEEALKQLLAELADTDEEKVEVDLRVPGSALDELGEVRLSLQVIEPDEDEDDEDEDDEDDGGVTVEQLDEEADMAADFLEGILDGMGLPGDLQIRVHEDRAEVEVVNVGSGRLIGRRGQTLDAIQDLLRCALQREFERRARTIIDVEGYRARRLEKYIDKAREAIDDARDSGDEQRLEPMDVWERKQIHQLVAEEDGVTSSSRGREPTRRVIIQPD
ncbi:MAG: KH domain-containing protein [Actinobacteria bacterium]|nr:KH domain-containing protein [Actinomycetota bacterium]